jgi:hypothetical protein
VRGRAAEQHSRGLLTKGFIGPERSAATDDAGLNRRRTGSPDRNTLVRVRLTPKRRKFTAFYPVGATTTAKFSGHFACSSQQRRLVRGSRH